MSGWICLHRKFLNWEWFNNGDMVRLFLYLLLEANYENKRWNGIVISRGQLLTGRKELAKNLNLSEQVVRTCLDRLKSTSEITIKSTNKYSIITICNYEFYNSIEYKINQQNNQQFNQQITNNQPTDNQQITTTKQINNYNNLTKEQEIDIAAFQKKVSNKNPSEEIFSSNSLEQNINSGGEGENLNPTVAPINTPLIENKPKDDKSTSSKKKSTKKASNQPSEESDEEWLESKGMQLKINYNGIMQRFNENNPNFKSLIAIKSKRREHVRARIKEYGLEAFFTMIEKAKASEFLTTTRAYKDKSGNDQKFKAEFDWMITPTYFPKIVEGNYDNKPDLPTNKNQNYERNNNNGGDPKITKFANPEDLQRRIEENERMLREANRNSWNKPRG